MIIISSKKLKILSFRVGTSKSKNIGYRVKETCVIMSTQVNIKPTTTLYPVIQWCQVHKICVFYVFYCNLKEKDHVRRNINSKKKKCLYVKSVLLLFWFAKN